MRFSVNLGGDGAGRRPKKASRNPRVWEMNSEHGEADAGFQVIEATSSEASNRGWHPPSGTHKHGIYPPPRPQPPTHPNLEAGLGMLWSQCSDGSRPLAPNPGPPRRPHPSWSFSGHSPQPAPTREPQFLQAPAARGSGGRRGGASEPSPAVIGRGAWRRAGSHAGPRLRVPRASEWCPARREAGSFSAGRGCGRVFLAEVRGPRGWAARGHVAVHGASADPRAGGWANGLTSLLRAGHTPPPPAVPGNGVGRPGVSRWAARPPAWAGVSGSRGLGASGREEKGAASVPKREWREGTLSFSRVDAVDLEVLFIKLSRTHSK